jgi:hypothetical protein
MDFGLIELCLVFGVVLALGLWELFRVKRELRRDTDKKDDRTRPPT